MQSELLARETLEACERKKQEAMAELVPLSEQTFEVAAEFWIKERSRYISSRTIRDYRNDIRTLKKIFLGMVLKEIHIGHIRHYQDWRSESAGPGRVNKEICCLNQVLKEAHLYQNIEPLFRPLRISPEGSGQSLPEQEQECLLEIAFSKKKWHLCAHCLNISFQTGCGWGELSGLRRRDVSLAEETIEIQYGAKNNYRTRIIPLTPSALESIEWLLNRWQKLGGTDPQQFLLPRRPRHRGQPFDFSKPMNTIKNAWGSIRRKWVNTCQFCRAQRDPEQLTQWMSGHPDCKHVGGRQSFRYYDTRVTTISRMLSKGIQPLTVEKMCGHCSEEMLRRYYKPQREVLREAINHVGLTRRPPATATARDKERKKA